MARVERLWNNAEEESYEYWRVTRLMDIIKYYNPASYDLDKAVLYNWCENKYSHGPSMYLDMGIIQMGVCVLSNMVENHFTTCIILTHLTIIRKF